MVKKEYDIRLIPITFNLQEVKDTLNEWGNEGWIVVHIQNFTDETLQEVPGLITYLMRTKED